MTITINEAISQLTSLKRKKITLEEIGKALGTSKQYIGQSKNKILTDEQKNKIENYFNVSLSEIKLDTIDDRINFAKKFFMEAQDENGNFFVVDAFGNSMEPEIRDKDKLLIRKLHEGETIEDNRIYLFTYDGKEYIRRLFDNIGQIIMQADNPNIPIRAIDKEDFDKFSITGQIMAVVHNL